MIKINLLLARKGPKKGGMKKEFIVLILSVVFLLAVFIFIQWGLNKKAEETLAQNAQKREEIIKYKSLTAEVEKKKQEQKMLRNRLDIINSLRKDKARAAMILDELSIHKPEKLQLDSLKKDGAKLGIEGVAMDDETIANFMTSLRKSKLFKNVDLVVSQQIEHSNKMKVKKFVLSCEIVKT
ncbi:MAG: PilN domain-containing protein [Desulfobacterales bacterium]|nr:PilN domain-containing protein [Desulfobacterales bacterium]